MLYDPPGWVWARPAIVALTLLAIPPIAINIDLGLRGVSAPETLDVATGTGMSASQRFALSSVRSRCRLRSPGFGRRR